MPLLRALSIAVLASFGICSAAIAGIDDSLAPCEAFNRSSAVFVGTALAPVTKIISPPDEPNFEMTVTPISVERAYFGTTASVMYVTPSGIEDRPTPGKRYLVYGGEYSARDVVMASPGYGAKEIDNATEDLAFLNALPLRPTGTILTVALRLKQRVYSGSHYDPVPLPGIRVRITAEYSKEAITDHEGKFIVVDLPPGEYELRPVLPDHLIAGDPATRFTTQLREGGCAGPVIDVSSNGRLRGIVRGPDGLPLRTTVDVVPADNGPDSAGRIAGMGSVHSDDQGMFLFTGLPAGRYYLGVSLYNAPNRTGPSYPRTYYPGTTNIGNAIPIVVGDGVETGGLDLQITETLAKGEVTLLVADQDGSNLKLTLCLTELEDLVKRRFTWELQPGIPKTIPVVEGQRYEIHVHGEIAGLHVETEPLVFTATAEKTTIHLKPDTPRKLH